MVPLDPTCSYTFESSKFLQRLSLRLEQEKVAKLFGILTALLCRVTCSILRQISEFIRIVLLKEID